MTNQLAIYFLALKDYMLPCINKQLFGVDCPGCGLQRSILFLLKGDFAAAFHMYPAIFTLVPLFAIVVLNRLFNLKHGNLFIIGLSISSVALILINFVFKLTH